MNRMTSSDAPLKVLYRDRRLLEETVRLVAPRLADAYDFNSAVALDKEHLSANDRVRLQDKAYSVEPKDPRRPRLLVLLEFQSGNDPDMALRMEEYSHLAATSAREVRAAGRTSRRRRGTDGLPEVLSIVIYNGKRPWRASTQGIVRRTGDDPPVAAPAYATVDLPRLATGPNEHGRRLRRGSRLATLAGLETASPERLPTLLAEAFRRYASAESAVLRRGLHLRVSAMLRRQGVEGGLPPLDECERLLAEQKGDTMTTMMDAQFERWRDRNLAQGQAQGRAQGRIALLERLAARRFGAGVAGQVTALLADVSDTSRLDEAGVWLVECDSGEALLEGLPAIVRGAGNGAPN